MQERGLSLGGNIRPLLLPLFAIVVFAAFSFLPDVRKHTVLAPSFWSWSAFLLTWWIVLAVRVGRSKLPLEVEFVPRSPHYLQAVVQLTLFTYWGWHWRQVYENADLLLAQVVFAYAFEMLLSWSRRKKYFLGFGPLPIIFSTNLFLWFRDDWFYLQFLMIGIGFLGKEFVRWNRDGKLTHIFNPSAFSLGLFSIVLILSDTTNLTWGPQIATTLSLAPNIYLVIFLLGLVVMFAFRTTLVTATAAAALFALSALYFQVVGVPYFIDSEIPIAVFLGLHLLVTDPSTSPRTPIGKAVFGFVYGIAVFALYEILGNFGAPTFYDKLLCVPLLNLSVQVIDRLVKNWFQHDWVERVGLQVAGSKSNAVHIVVWVAFFAAMTAIGSTDGIHRGDRVPFWQEACAEGSEKACSKLVHIESVFCGDGVGWACNELGVSFAEGMVTKRDPDLSQAYLQRSCQLGYWTGCVNIRGLSLGMREMRPGSLSRDVPSIHDLRALLREGGKNLLASPEAELLSRACDHGWTFACSTDGTRYE